MQISLTNCYNFTFSLFFDFLPLLGYVCPLFMARWMTEEHREFPDNWIEWMIPNFPNWFRQIAIYYTPWMGFNISPFLPNISNWNAIEYFKYFKTFTCKRDPTRVHSTLYSFSSSVSCPCPHEMNRSCVVHVKLLMDGTNQPLSIRGKTSFSYLGNEMRNKEFCGG